MNRILITVMGGIAEVDQSTIPKGIEVEVRDFDINGHDGGYLRQDGNGDNYIESLWTRIE